MTDRIVSTLAVAALIAVTAALYLLILSSLDRLVDECSTAVRTDPAACIPTTTEGPRP